MLKPLSYYQGALAAVNVTTHAGIIRELIDEIKFADSVAEEAKKEVEELRGRIGLAARIADDAVAGEFEHRSYEGARVKQLAALNTDMKAWLAVSESARELIGGIEVGPNGSLKIDNDWKRIEA